MEYHFINKTKFALQFNCKTDTTSYLTLLMAHHVLFLADLTSFAQPFASGANSRPPPHAYPTHSPSFSVVS